MTTWYLQRCGRFRWAALQLQALCDLNSDAAVRERIGRLPPTLEDLYQEYLVKLENYQAEADRKYAKHTLAWLLCAHRTLRSDEFLAAVSIAVPSGSHLTKEQVLGLCHNFVIFDQTLDTFRFAHLSVREFLEKQAAYASPLTNAWAAEACLLMLTGRADAYLSIHLPSESEYPFDRNNRITSYADVYWAPHCQAAASERSQGQLMTLLSDFMSSKITPQSPFFLWSMRLDYLPFDIDFLMRRRLGDCRSQSSPIFTACAFDIPEVVEQGNAGLVDANLINSAGKSCLHVAVKYGSCGVLRILVGIISLKITEEVVKAAAGNQEKGEEVMTLLLQERGGDVKITEEVVKAAAGNLGNGEEVMALLLQERGGDVEITEEVVKAAAGNWGNGDEVMALLLRQRPPAVRAYVKEEVYLIASACGQLAVINLLSRHFSHCPIKEEWVTTAKFYIAAKIGDVRSINNILDKGIYPDIANLRGVTPLWISAQRGNTAVVDILIKTRKVDINARSVSGRSPIFWPSARGFDRIVAMLIDAGARTDFIDKEGQTAISMARKHGHCRIVNLLGRLETEEEGYWPVDNTEGTSETGRGNQLTPSTIRGCRQVRWALWTTSVLALLLFVGFHRSSENSNLAFFWFVRSEKSLET